MFKQIFKNIDGVLWKEADYTEQTSWVLFFKYLDLQKAFSGELAAGNNNLKEEVA